MVRCYEAFEMDMYRRMMRITWTEHRTNNSILEELQPTRRFMAEVKKRKLQYTDRAVRADNLCRLRMCCMAPSPTPGIDAVEDQEDAGQMISSSGLVHQWRSVFNVHVTETDGVPWCLCRRHPILNHEEGPRQGKALGL